MQGENAAQALPLFALPREECYLFTPLLANAPFSPPFLLLLVVIVVAAAAAAVAVVSGGFVLFPSNLL